MAPNQKLRPLLAISASLLWLFSYLSITRIALTGLTDTLAVVNTHSVHNELPTITALRTSTSDMPHYVDIRVIEQRLWFLKRKRLPHVENETLSGCLHRAENIAKNMFNDIKPVHIDITRESNRKLYSATNEYLLTKLNAVIDNDNGRILVGNKSYSPQPVSEALSTEVKEWATRICEPRFVPTAMPLSTWETVKKEIMVFREKLKSEWERVIMKVKTWLEDWTDIDNHPELRGTETESLYPVQPTTASNKNPVEREYPVAEHSITNPATETPTSTSTSTSIARPITTSSPVLPVSTSPQHPWTGPLKRTSVLFDKYILFPLFLVRIAILLALLTSTQMPPTSRPWSLPQHFSPLSPVHVAAAEAVFAVNDALQWNLGADILVLGIRTLGAGSMAWSEDPESLLWGVGAGVWGLLYVVGEGLVARWGFGEFRGLVKEVSDLVAELRGAE